MAQPDACAIGCRLCVVISCRFHVCQQLRTAGKGLENCDLQGAERVQPHPPKDHLLGGTLRRSCIARRLVSQFSVSAALLFAWISRITCKHLPLSSIISVGNQFGFNFESMQSGPSGLRRFPRKAMSSERVVDLCLKTTEQRAELSLSLSLSLSFASQVRLSHPAPHFLTNSVSGLVFTCEEAQVCLFL